MKLMFDTNVLLDVFQEREPHYQNSATCLQLVITNKVTGVVPAHAVSTLFYLITKYTNHDRAVKAIKNVLTHFDVAPCTDVILKEALKSMEVDFEDAIVWVSAIESSCDFILTRNIKHFSKFPVPAKTPTEFIAEHSEATS